MAFEDVLIELGLSQNDVPRLELLCQRLFQEIGVYLVRCYAKGLVRNTFIRLMEAKKKYKALPIDADPNEKSVEIPKIDNDNFRLPYCRTGHSTQGITLNRSYCIHNAFCRYISPNWLWTAITRATKLSNVFIYVGNKQKEMAKLDFAGFVSRKLNSYKSNDEDKGWIDEEYSAEKMIEMAEQHYGKQCRGVLGCSCDRRLTLDETDDAISFDRIKNILGHRWSNLRVICVDCNRRSKQQDEKHM
jgi:hypothetical protein